MTLPLRIELAMTFKAVFPDILASDRSGHGRPEAIRRFSCRNILICPPDASLLRLVPAGCRGSRSRVCAVVISGRGAGLEGFGVVFNFLIRTSHWLSGLNRKPPGWPARSG